MTNCCSLLGLDWIRIEKNGRILNPNLLNNVSEKDTRLSKAAKIAREVKKSFPDVTGEGLGYCKEYTAKIYLKNNAMPAFRKARPVAYASLPDVDKQLKRLAGAGVIERVHTSLFAAPVVVVMKTNGSIRLCAGYSTGLNAAIEDDHYPLPTAESVFTTLYGGKLFSKIDLSEAYLRIPVEAECQELLTMNTPRRRFKMKRLPFGVKTDQAHSSG